jgi:ATP-dependent Clp protease ATP-binding subunit ClpB
LFDSEDAMTRIDMSEFGEKHTVSRLIGAPPGYIGYEESGMLTESVRRRPYQVILLDEFEKAHPSVWTLLLQLFDDGRLTDSHGRTVDFRNTIIVMTSNMGAHLIADLPAHLTGIEPQVQESVMEVIRQTLPPELLNRISEVVPFARLQRENMEAIAKIGLNNIAKRLEENQNMILDVSQPALDCISERGYDVRYGARPLKRVLTRDILNPLSRVVLDGGVVDGETVRVRTRAEAEKFSKEHPDISFGYISSDKDSVDKNDVVIMRNNAPVEDQSDEDGTSLLHA